MAKTGITFRVLPRTEHLFALVEAADLQGLRALIEDADIHSPGRWQTAEGRFILRGAAISAIQAANLECVQYLCGETFGVEKGAFKRDSAQPWLPLQYAAQLGCEDICVYLLTLTSAEGDLSRLWEKANHYGIAHFAAGHGQLFFPRALMDCGVDIDLRNARCYTPLCFAVSTCRMPVIRFLLEQFRSRGKEEQDVWRDLIERPPLDETLDPFPLIFCAIRHNSLGKQIITHEAKLAMVKYLVKDVGVDTWAEARFSYTDGEDIDHCTGHAVTRRHVLLPLHAAAIEGNQAVLDFFLTECGMAVDTCTPLSHFTALHFLALSTQSETELLPVVAWLVDKKGADATCRHHRGRTAAKLASRSDKPEMEHYLQRQKARQAVRKVKDKEEARKKAAAAATMAARMKEAEEGMAALLLELEAAAASSSNKKKKAGKAGGGGKKKKDRR